MSAYQAYKYCTCNKNNGKNGKKEEGPFLLMLMCDLVVCWAVVESCCRWCSCGGRACCCVLAPPKSMLLRLGTKLPNKSGKRDCSLRNGWLPGGHSPEHSSIQHGQISPKRVASAVYFLANLFLKQALRSVQSYLSSRFWALRKSWCLRLRPFVVWGWGRGWGWGGGVNSLQSSSYYCFEFNTVVSFRNSYAK